MANIAMVRVDERLVHGQIITKWVEKMGADGVVIIDDEVAGNPVMAKVFRMALPKGIRISVHNLNDGINFLTNDDQGEKVILLVRDLCIIRELYRGGVGIKNVNIGRIPADVGRKKVYKNVYLSHRDKDIIGFFKSKQVPIYIQAVPDSMPVDVYSLDI